MTTKFSNTFSFMDGNLFIHSAQQDICDKVLEIVLTGLAMEPQWTPTPQMMPECENVSGELDDEDDPRAI